MTDADIREFFASVQHRVVLQALGTIVADERLIALVGAWLAAPALRAGRTVRRDVGLPLGSPLSPLLANLVLHPLDIGLWRPDTTYVRFADDLVACCPDEQVARQQLDACAAILADLGLRLHDEKSRVLDSRRESFVFLGHLLRARPTGEEREREIPPYAHAAPRRARLPTDRARPASCASARRGRDTDGAGSSRSRDRRAGAGRHRVGRHDLVPHQRRGRLVDERSRALVGKPPHLAQRTPNVLRDQILATLDERRCLALGRTIIGAKLANQKRLLQRHQSRGEVDLSQMFRGFGKAERALEQATTRSALMGAEGLASRTFFAGIAALVDPAFGFGGRVRRPPRDPVNAMLSFGYVLLTQELATVCQQVGLDSCFGVLHQLRPGRPSLALDLVEELRPVIVDSLVLAVVHRRILRPDHFVDDPGTGGVRLRDEARKVFLREYELRMLSLFAHEASGERVSYRRALTLQAQQLARALRHPGISYLPIRLK